MLCEDVGTKVFTWNSRVSLQSRWGGQLSMGHPPEGLGTTLSFPAALGGKCIFPGS